MNCSECLGVFSELHDGRLPAGAAAAARAHLGDCPSCSAGYRDFSRALSALEAEPLERVPDGFEEGVLALLSSGRGRPPSPEIRPDRRPYRRRPAAALAGAGAVAAAAVLAAFLLARFLPERVHHPQSTVDGATVDSATVDSATVDSATVDSDRASVRNEVRRLAETLRRVQAEGEAREAQVRARDGEWNRQVREIGESLSRKQAEYEHLEKEKRDLSETLERLERDRVALASLVEDLRRKAAERPPPETEAPRKPPEPKRVAAPPVLSERPAAVAIDRRRGDEGELSIDLRGPDSRVIPGLIALALSEDDELGNLALSLLRERVGGMLPADPAGGEAGAAPPPRAFFQSVGTWLGEAWGIGPETETEARPVPAEERRREVARIDAFWRSKQAGADTPAEKL